MNKEDRVIRKAELLSVSEACTDISWPAPCEILFARRPVEPN